MALGKRGATAGDVVHGDADAAADGGRGEPVQDDAAVAGAAAAADADADPDAEVDEEEESPNMDAIYSVQKMAEVLEAGPDTERDFILFEMQQMLDHCLSDTLRILVPVLCELVPQWSVELQLKAAERLFDVVSLQLPAAVASMITSASFAVVASARHATAEDIEDVYTLWGGVLVDAMPTVEWAAGELATALATLDAHARSRGSEPARKLAARALGALAQCLPAASVEAQLLPRVLALAADESAAVRGTVVESLAFLGATMPTDHVAERIWPRFVAVLDEGSPEEPQVRATALRSVAHVLEKQRHRCGIGIQPEVAAAAAAAAAGGAAADKAATPRGADGSKKRGSKVKRKRGFKTPGASLLFKELLPPLLDVHSAFSLRYASEDQRLVSDDTYLLLEVVSEVFGQLVYAVTCASAARVGADTAAAAPVGADFREHVYRAYLAMATCNGPLIRRNCAYNLPGMAISLGEPYAAELSGLAEYFAKDSDEEVRWIVAAGIHESTALLASGGGVFDRLFAAVCALLADSNALIRSNALGHFHDAMSALAAMPVVIPVEAADGVGGGEADAAAQVEEVPAEAAPPGAAIDRLCPLFDNLELLSEGEWRVQESLAKQLELSIGLMPPNSLQQSVLPLLYRLMEQGTPVVRTTAMRAIIKGVRTINLPADRDSAVDRYWGDAAGGPFWMRLALLDGGVVALSVFSRRRVAEIFAPRMMDLVEDPVVNVRIRLARTLPLLAPVCAAHAQYAAVLKRLGADADVDVRNAIDAHPAAAAAAMAAAAANEAADREKQRAEDELYGRGAAPRVLALLRKHAPSTSTGNMPATAVAGGGGEGGGGRADEPASPTASASAFEPAAPDAPAAAAGGGGGGDAKPTSVKDVLTGLGPSLLRKLSGSGGHDGEDGPGSGGRRSGGGSSGGLAALVRRASGSGSGGDGGGGGGGNEKVARDGTVVVVGEDGKKRRRKKKKKDGADEASGAAAGAAEAPARPPAGAAKPAAAAAAAAAAIAAAGSSSFDGDAASSSASHAAGSGAFGRASSTIGERLRAVSSLTPRPSGGLVSMRSSDAGRRLSGDFVRRSSGGSLDAGMPESLRLALEARERERASADAMRLPVPVTVDPAGRPTFKGPAPWLRTSNQVRLPGSTGGAGGGGGGGGGGGRRRRCHQRRRQRRRRPVGRLCARRLPRVVARRGRAALVARRAGERPAAAALGALHVVYAHVGAAAGGGVAGKAKGAAPHQLAAEHQQQPKRHGAGGGGGGSDSGGGRQRARRSPPRRVGRRHVTRQQRERARLVAVGRCPEWRWRGQWGWWCRRRRRQGRRRRVTGGTPRRPRRGRRAAAAAHRVGHPRPFPRVGAVGRGRAVGAAVGRSGGGRRRGGGSGVGGVGEPPQGGTAAALLYACGGGGRRCRGGPGRRPRRWRRRRRRRRRRAARNQTPAVDELWPPCFLVVGRGRGGGGVQGQAEAPVVLPQGQGGGGGRRGGRAGQAQEPPIGVAQLGAEMRGCGGRGGALGERVGKGR